MHGEPIQSVNVGIQAMLQALRQDPHALDTVHLSVITFDLDVKEVFPLTPLPDIQMPEITCPQSGATYLGEALALTVSRIDRDVRQSTADEKGDWQPMVFLMTDGGPSDVARFDEMVHEVKARKISRFIACAAGPKAKDSYLKRLTDTVVSLDTTDSAAFSNYFKWVSASVGMSTQSAGVVDADALPPPPKEIQIVV